MKYLNRFTVCQTAVSNLDRWQTKKENLLWGRWNHSWSTRVPTSGCESLEDSSSDTSQGKGNEVIILRTHTNQTSTSVNRAILTVLRSNYYPLSSQIIKAHVDRFNPNLTIPSCELSLEWTGGENVPPQRLRHRVTLKGARPPTYFHIRHDPQAVGKSI